MAVERRQLALGGVAVLVLSIAVWTWWPRPSATIVAAAAVTAPRARGGKPPAAVGPMAPVKLEALKTSRDAPGQAPRNPFRFQPKVVPPPPRPVVTTPPIVEGPRVPPPPPGPPPAPPIPLKLIGVVERANGVKWAVLSDGKAVMYGKDGDIIDGRYSIVKIGTESIEMTHADGRGRQVIRLTGQ